MKLHLEFIQAAIGRMAQNSFAIRTWTVTLVSAMFALAAYQANALFALLCYIPLCGFWVLDAYYMRQERLFRKLYEKARSSGEDLQLSMDTSAFEGDVDSWLCTMFSATSRVFYGGIGIAVLIIMFGLRR